MPRCGSRCAKELYYLFPSRGGVGVGVTHCVSRDWGAWAGFIGESQRESSILMK